MFIDQLYIDLDGVLADFFGGVCRLLDRDPGPPTSDMGLARHFDMDDDAFWRRIDDAGHTFWAELEPYPWTHELLAIAGKIVGSKGFVVIATSPTWHGSSAHGKMEWMDKYVGAGSHFRDFMIGTHKHLLAHSTKQMLIDDRPGQVEKFDEAGGRAILWPMPWNGTGTLDSRRDECLEGLAGLATAIDEFREYTQ